MEKQYINTLRSINMLTGNQKHLFYKQSQQVEFILKQLVFIIQARDKGENEIDIISKDIKHRNRERRRQKKKKENESVSLRLHIYKLIFFVCMSHLYWWQHFISAKHIPFKLGMMNFVLGITRQICFDIPLVCPRETI